MDRKRRPNFFLEIPVVSITFGAKKTPMASPMMAGTLRGQRFPGVPEAFSVSCISCGAKTKENIGKRSGNRPGTQKRAQMSAAAGVPGVSDSYNHYENP